MTIPFHCASSYEMTINGMVIIVMFFGCCGSSEKNDIMMEG